MFKKFMIISAVALCLFACNKKTSEETNNQSCCQSEGNSVYTVESLMNVAENQVGKEVTLQGVVTHVCKHSGKKCFLTNEAGDLSMQVMAGGDIASFGNELMGSDIVVKGTLKETRISGDEIDAREQAVNEEMKAHNHEGGSCCGTESESTNEAAHQCASKMNNIKQMRAWMEKNNKNYYAIYSVDGLSYELVD